MNPFFTIGFLGSTTISFKSEKFKASIVDYTSKVSEEWHWHEKFHLSSIIHGGNLESRKKEDIQVTPGKLMVYDQGEIHRNRHTAHPSRNLNIELDESFFSNEIHFSNLRADDNSNIELYSVYLELLLNDNNSEQSIFQILKTLFWIGDHEDQSNWMPQLESILIDNWKEFPSLQTLSAELDVHPITISKYFAKTKGITLSNYMRRIKVKRAVDSLLNSTTPISEIAFGCGFSDQSHLTRLTKYYIGYTPGEIRALR